MTEKIGSILETKQPSIYKSLNKKKKRTQRKGRGPKKEHLSFSDIERMMRSNHGVDERKCRGR